MTFNFNEQKEVVALLGAGSMGTSIVERIAVNKIVLLGDISQKSLDAARERLEYNGYEVATMIVDGSDKESIEAFAQRAASLGPVKHFINTAGASPNQASPEHIIKLDLIGTAYSLDSFGRVMTRGGSAIIISSQAAHMLPTPLTPEVENALSNTPSDELAALPCLSKEAVPNSGMAYVMSKKCNQLRARSAAVAWGERGARVNTISPGIILTPLAYHELNADSEVYQQMIKTSPVHRVGTPAEVARAAEFLLSDDAAFITGTDLLIDGGVIAAMKSGANKVEIH